VFPAHLEDAITKIQGELTERHQPKPEIEQRLIREWAVNSAKPEYCEELLKIDLDQVVQRVCLCWDGDQQAIADRFYGRLGRRPEIVAPALARTRQGADRLLTDLKGLAAVLNKKRVLTGRQHQRLCNLFGVPLDIREDCPLVPPANDGPALLARIATEVDRLERLQVGSLIDLDEQRKVLVLAAMPYGADADTKQLKRYETTNRNNLEKAREEFRRFRAEAAAAAEERRRRWMDEMLAPKPLVQPPGSGGAEARPDPAGGGGAAPGAAERVFVVPPKAAPFVVKPEDRDSADRAAEWFAKGCKAAEKHARERQHRRRRSKAGRPGIAVDLAALDPPDTSLIPSGSHIITVLMNIRLARKPGPLAPAPGFIFAFLARVLGFGCHCTDRLPCPRAPRLPAHRPLAKRTQA
jgi:hypothetical protein